MRYFLALFLALSVIPSVAKADILPDNMHPISNCVAVSNIAEYPDYYFVWKIDGYRGIPSSERITSSDPMCNVSGSYTLLAIKKTDWNKVQYGVDDPTSDSGNPADMWAQDPQNADILIASNYTISFASFAPDTSDAQSEYTTVRIDFASDTGVTAHTASTLTTDENGEPIGDEETESNPLSTLAKVLIAVGVLGVGAMICAWKKK